MDDTARGRVAIVGAGIGGLTLAIALHRRGVPVTVYERAPELREVGAAVALGANGLRPMESLGVLDALEEVATEPTELVYRRWDTHDRVQAFPVGRDRTYRSRFGAPYLGIHRAEFQRVLAEACPEGSLRLGSSVEAVTDRGDRVELELGDGTVEEASIAVGADGVHSRLRAHVDPAAEPVYTGTSGFRGLVPVADLPLLPDPHAIQFWMGPDAHLLHYAIGADGDTVNFLAVLEGPREWPGPIGPVTSEPGTLAAAFDGWAPAARQMVEAVPQSDRWPLFTLPPMRRWSRGRVVLLGDAVHTMLPHHGQGANQTVEDAVVLDECLSSPDGREAAFARYERLRRARTRQVQRSSLDTSPLLHLPDGPEARRRDADLDGLDEWLGWIHGYDAVGTAREAHAAAR